MSPKRSCGGEAGHGMGLKPSVDWGNSCRAVWSWNSKAVRGLHFEACLWALSLPCVNGVNTSFLPWKATKGPGFWPDTKDFFFLTWRQSLPFLRRGLLMLGWHRSSWDSTNLTPASLCTDKTCALQHPHTAAKRGGFALQGSKRNPSELGHSGHNPTIGATQPGASNYT